MNTQLNKVQPITVTHITDEDQRLLMFPLHFGTRNGLMFEQFVYTLADNFCPSYNGGYWEFFRLSNGGFFMHPHGNERMELRSTNGTEGIVARDTVGIVLCLFAYSIMTERGAEPQRFQDHFDWLREYAFTHADYSFILSAID